MSTKKFLVFVVLAILVLQVGFVSSQNADEEEKPEGVNSDSEETSEEIDLSDNFEGDEKVIAKGVKETVRDDSVVLEFKGDGKHSLKVGDKTYENISEGKIVLNEKGEIKKADFMTGDEGGNYTINGVSIEAPPNSNVVYGEVKEDGTGGLRLPNKTRISEIKGESKIYGNNLEYSQNGKSYSLSGSLFFDKDGIPYVPPRPENIGDLNFDWLYKWGETNVEGVSIDHYTSNTRSNIYFGDVEDTSDSYFSFKERSFSASGDFNEVVFERKNEYINLEKGDDFVIRSSSKDSDVTLENRENEGLIPKLTLEGGVRVDNGKLELNYDGSKFNVPKQDRRYRNPLGLTTSPVEMVPEEGANKLLVDNANRFFILEKNRRTDFIEESYSGLNARASSRIKYNYLDEKDVRRDTGKDFSFKGDVKQGRKQAILARFRDYWTEVNPSLKNSSEEIVFGTNSYMNTKTREKGLGIGGGTAMTDPINKKVTFSTKNFDFESLNHELGHVKHFSIRGIDSDKAKEIRNNLAKSYKKYKDVLSSCREEFGFDSDKVQGCLNDKNADEIKSDYKRLAGRYRSLIGYGEGTQDSTHSEFDKEWQDVAGEYNNVENTHNYKEKKGNGPAFGYVMPYGGLNPPEDVATYLEKVNEPGFFKPLLQEDNKWHEKYRKKLKLLHEYDFISTERYNKILEVAGVEDEM